jgi:hypothetical protein
MWLRRLPVYALLLIHGQIVGTFIAVPLIHYFKSRSTDPAATLHTWSITCLSSLALWAICCIPLTNRLFCEAGPLCDKQIQHGNGLMQRIARSAFGPGNAARPDSAIVSDIQDLNLTK